MFTDPPNVNVSPSLQFANSDDYSVTITCSVSAYPEWITAIGWRKVSVDGLTNTSIDALDSSKKYSIEKTEKTLVLQIFNIVLKDDANYVCFATNEVGTGLSNNAPVEVTDSKYILTRITMVWNFWIKSAAETYVQFFNAEYIKLIYIWKYFFI